MLNYWKQFARSQKLPCHSLPIHFFPHFLYVTISSLFCNNLIACWVCYKRSI